MATLLDLLRADPGMKAQPATTVGDLAARGAKVSPLRITPLNQPTGTGLRIRPLDDFFSSLPTPAPASGDATVYSQVPLGAQPSFPGGGGGGGVGAGSGSIEGMSGPQIAAQFGHMAGISPLSAALTSLTPSLTSATSTPAGILGSIFGAIAPSPFGTLTSMIAHAMQQQAINDAVKINPPIRHNEEDISTIGQLQVSPLVSFIQQGALDMTSLGKLAQGLGLTGPQLNAINQNALFGRGVDPSDPSVAPEGQGVVGMTGIQGSLVDAVAASADDGTGPSGGGGNASGTGTGGPGDSAPSGGGVGAAGEWHTGGMVGKGAPKGPERKGMLKEGEFVVRKEAVQMHRPLLEAINRGEPVKKLKKLMDYMMEPMEA